VDDKVKQKEFQTPRTSANEKRLDNYKASLDKTKAMIRNSILIFNGRNTINYNYNSTNILKKEIRSDHEQLIKKCEDILRQLEVNTSLVDAILDENEREQFFLNMDEKFEKDIQSILHKMALIKREINRHEKMINKQHKGAEKKLKKQDRTVN
jgi:hypothetical protein